MTDAVQLATNRPDDETAIPNAFGIDVTVIPTALRTARVWVNWRALERDGKRTKVPCMPNGRPASTMDPATWSNLEAVLNPSVRVDGIGCVFTGETGPDGLCVGGIDLDALNKRRESEADDSGMFARKKRATRVVREARSCGAYIEVSPSGGGIHVLGRMRPLTKGCKRDAVEVYTSGRYFTVTTKGERGDLADIADLAEALINEVAPNLAAGSPAATVAPQPGTVRTGQVAWNALPANVRDVITGWLNSITDGGPKDRAARKRLWDGDLSDAGDQHKGNHSVADLSMISQLIRRGLTDDEADLAMRASGLYRAKWDARRRSSTYGWVTIAKARQSLNATARGGGTAVWAGTAASALASTGNAARWAPPGQRPVIEIHAGTYHLAADAGLAAIAAAGAPFYQQDVRLVEVCRVPHRLPSGQTTMTPAARAVPAASLTRTLTQCVDWRRWTGKQLRVTTEPPKDVVAQILSMAGQWPFPPLRGVCTTQLMRPDGSLLTEPGYDAATGLVLFDPPVMPPILDHPDRAAALAGLRLLDDLLTEFPFVSDHGTSRASALSLLLTVIQRGMMPVAPMYVTVKPQPGTGGSYLADIAGALALGDVPPVMAWSVREEENDKRLTGMALAQKPIIAIDNVSGRLHSDFLCQLTERPRLSCRPLGRSDQVEVSNSSVVIANGNNLEISTDEVRRTVLIQLDANVENPEARTFTQNPVALVRADRGKYVAAVLTVVRAYHLAGRPGCLPSRPSFETWSDTVRSALVWLGQPDPDLSLEHVGARDTVASQRDAVFSAWAAELQLGVGYRTQELVKVANEATGGTVTTTAKLRRPDLLEALLAVAPAKYPPDTIDPRRLGSWLQRHGNNVAAGRKLTIDNRDRTRPRFVLS